MWQEGQTPVPGYQLEKFLGKGNFGEVWQSTSPGRTKCALKFLNLQEKQGRKEYRAIQRLKQIRHANLMPINAIWLLDVGQQVIPDESLDALQPFMEDTHRRTLAVTPQIPEQEKPKTLVIAMPLAEGNLLELLHRRKKQGKDIPVEELLLYMMDGARALDFLNTARHDLGGGQVAVQHGDVKPENLVLLGGSVVLCDFGVARTFSGGANVRGTTLGGTLAYMAPECMAGTTSPHSDQFSLAISYCELRAGQLPFPHESLTQLIDDRKRGQLRLDGLTNGEQRVIRKACSVNPSKRFNSNVELIEALRAELFGSQSKSRPKRLLALGSLAALVLVAGLAVWSMDLWAPQAERIPPVPPVAKTGKEYYAEALNLLNAPSVSDAQFAAARDFYSSALDADFPAAVPEPRRMGVQNNDRRQVYGTRDLRTIYKLVAIHPQNDRVVLVGNDGISLVALTRDAETTVLSLNIESPIASVHWLDENHVLVGDCQAALWRVNLEAKSTTKIANGVLRIASSPQSELAVAASDGDDAGVGNVWRITPTEISSLLSPDSSPNIISPLIALDVAGQWALLAEEFDDEGIATILRPATDASPIEIETETSPFCSLCIRVGEDCFAIVGGRSKKHLSGLAMIKLVGSDTARSVTHPTFPGQQNLFDSGGRRVRSLAAYVSTKPTRGRLATGQDVSSGSAGTDLWEIAPDGTMTHDGMIGREPKGRSISSIAFDPSGEWIARGTDYGEVLLTKLSNRTIDFQLMTEDYQAEVIQLQFASGKLFCTFDDASVMIWNFYECKMVFEACTMKNLPLPIPEFSRPLEG